MSERRAPLVPAYAPENQFGWRHEGPGPQWPEDDDADEPLLPQERFAHPALQRPPQYMPARNAAKTFWFIMHKGCAGLAHPYRVDAYALYERIQRLAMTPDDGPAVRWTLSGLHSGAHFVQLHTLCRFTIEELAYLVRTAFGPRHAPYRDWLNQWGRDPERPLPTLPASIELESEDALEGLHIDDIAPGDDRRIDIEGTTYIKLNGHIYWLVRRAQT